MGKTNLVGLMVCFTVEEAAAEKESAHEKSVSVSNLLRERLGYHQLKKGAPKRIMPTTIRNSAAGEQSLSEVLSEAEINDLLDQFPK